MPERKFDPREFIPNSTQVPNVVLDWLMAQLSGAETKVLLFFIRQRYGFQKFTGKFSYTIPEIQNGIIMRTPDGEARQVSAGTGLGKSAVFGALENLEKHKIISIVSRGRRKVANAYRLTIPDVDAAQFIVRKSDHNEKLKVENQTINDGVIVRKSDLNNGFIGLFSDPLRNQVLRETKNKIPDPEKKHETKDAQGAGPKGPGEGARVHHPSKAESAYIDGYTHATGTAPIMTAGIVIRINKLARDIGEAYFHALPGFFANEYARGAGFEIGLLQANPNKYLPRPGGTDPLIQSARRTAEILRGAQNVR